MGRFHIGAVTDLEPGHWGGLKCLAMEPMCQIMFYYQLPSSDTIHKWTLAPEVGRFHIGVPKTWNPDTGADTKCPAMEPICQLMFYNQLPTSDTIHKWTLAPEVGWFHIGALTDVEPVKLGWTPSVRLWNQCVKPCFIINCQLLTPFTSGPSFQKWAGSTSVPSLVRSSVRSPIWNPDNGVDSKCSDMELMCQIMFYNQLPTSDTIHRWTLAPELGKFIIGAFTDAEPGQWGVHQVCGYGTDVSNHVQLPTSDTIHKLTMSPEVSRFPSPMWNLDTGADSKCPAMELKCQIMFYNQLPTSDTIHKWTLSPEMGSSTSVPSPIWSLDTGVDTKFPDMELMCQIMFYNQLPTTDTIHKWTLAPEVGSFQISAFTDVEPRHWARHQVSGYGTDVSNHVL